MPVKLERTCLCCGEAVMLLEEETAARCALCGAEFEADTTCPQQHFVCYLCRQIAARKAILAHCQAGEHAQPYPLLLELMQLPGVAMHGPEHHLLLTAALLTAFCRQMGREAELPALLEEANTRSMGVPGGACGAWGICGAAIGSGIFLSILTGAGPYAEEDWKSVGQLTARCGDAISREGGPRCCKRDSFLALTEAIRYSNAALGTQFELPKEIRCDFYPNNKECKGRACPFFPARRSGGMAQNLI